MKKLFYLAMFAVCLSACNSPSSSNEPETPKEKPQDINFMVVSDLTPLCGMNESEMLNFMKELNFNKLPKSECKYNYQYECDYYFTRGNEGIGIYTLETNIVRQIDYEAKNMRVTPAQAAEWFEYHGRSVNLGSKNLSLQFAEYSIDENEGESYNGLINGLKDCTGEEKNIAADLTYSPSAEIGRDAFVWIGYTRENYNSLYDCISITIDNIGYEGEMKQEHVFL